MLLGRNSSIHSREKLVGAIAQVSDSAFRARIKSVLSVDVSDQLKMVSVPVLCLHATQDWIVPSSASRHIAGTLPSARIILVVGPHCLLQAVPEETANVIRVFIEDIRSASTIGGVELVVM
jgi:pimeloyl-ACP methyl ester carboxylesterase